jgi:hypothetical protein
MLQALFAQYNDYDYSSPMYTESGTDEASFAASMLFMVIILVIVGLPSIVGMWKMFVKAGRPGWAAIVPFYNLYNILLLVGRPTSWMWFLVPLLVISWIPVVSLLVLIPMVVFSVILCIDLAKSYGKDGAWGILLFFFTPIILLILGLGKAKYVGPSVNAAPATVEEPPYPTKKPATRASKVEEKDDDTTDSDK